MHSIKYGVLVVNPRVTIHKNIRVILKSPFVWLCVLIYICLFPKMGLSIEVKTGDNEVTISWIKPTRNEDGTQLNDLDGYYIYRSEGPTETFQRLNEKPVSGICYTDTTPINGMTYFYTVTAVDLSGNESKRSPLISATPNILPPSRLKAKPGDGRVELFWEAYEKSPLKGYYVYRRNPMEKEPGRLTRIPIPDPFFTDDQVANGIPYFYKVCCVGMDGIEGLPSQEIGATPMAVIPEELSSVRSQYIQEASGNRYILLSWDASKEEDIVGYKIYRRLSDERQFTLLTPDPISETEFRDSSVMPDTGYLYSVVAVNESAMESQYPKESRCFTSAVYISSFDQDAGDAAKKAGDKICFCITGEPGIIASYQVEGLTTQIPMQETSPGIYRACLEIEDEMSIEKARVMGYLKDAEGNMSSMAAARTITIDNLPPNIIKNAASEWENGCVTVRWESPEGEFEKFEIYRQEDGSIQTTGTGDLEQNIPIKTISGDKTSYADTRVKPDHTYQYTIFTVDRAGNRSEPFQSAPVHIPYQTGIPLITRIRENTAGMPQRTGDRIEVELIGEEVCQASFSIPGITDEPILMHEKALGEYSGYYIVRAEDQTEEGMIQVCLNDNIGNVNCRNAPSGLTINSEVEDSTPPEIHDIRHNAFEIAGFSGDLVPGNTLEVTLRGEAGCRAYFVIRASDLSPDPDYDPFKRQEMLEIQDTPGSYQGSYTIGWEEESIDEGYVWACLSDRAGNKIWKHSEERIALDTRPRIKVTPEDNILWADEESKTRIAVKVTDANGDPVEGHLMALTLTTTDEYTGVMGGGDLGEPFSKDTAIDFDQITDSWGEFEDEYEAGFAAKTAIVVAKDLTTGHSGAGYILSMIKEQKDIRLISPVTRAKLLETNPYQLILSADPDRLTADGVSSAWVTAQLADSEGRTVEKEGVLVSFFLEGENGSISESQAYTDFSGEAAIRYTAGIIRGTIIITGICNSNDAFDGLTGQTRITLMSDAPAIIEFSAPDHLEANGTSSAPIKVWVADINKNPVQQAMVEFSLLRDGRGSLSAVTEATDFNGWAECNYTTPDLSGQPDSVATIQAKITSKAPTEEEMARAVGTIFIPELYPDMEEDEEVIILEWLFRKGDEIKQGTPIVRIETQKGESFLKAPVSGELVKISVHRGEEGRLGQSIGQIQTEEDFWETD